MADVSLGRFVCVWFGISATDCRRGSTPQAANFGNTTPTCDSSCLPISVDLSLSATDSASPLDERLILTRISSPSFVAARVHDKPDARRSVFFFFLVLADGSRKREDTLTAAFARGRVRNRTKDLSKSQRRVA